jgi:hypothetical protein
VLRAYDERILKSNEALIDLGVVSLTLIGRGGK